MSNRRTPRGCGRSGARGASLERGHAEQRALRGRSSSSASVSATRARGLNVCTRTSRSHWPRPATCSASGFARELEPLWLEDAAAVTGLASGARDVWCSTSCGESGRRAIAGLEAASRADPVACGAGCQLQLDVVTGELRKRCRVRLSTLAQLAAAYDPRGHVGTRGRLRIRAQPRDGCAHALHGGRRSVSTCITRRGRLRAGMMLSPVERAVRRRRRATRRARALDHPVAIVLVVFGFGVALGQRFTTTQTGHDRDPRAERSNTHRSQPMRDNYALSGRCVKN